VVQYVGGNGLGRHAELVESLFAVVFNQLTERESANLVLNTVGLKVSTFNLAPYVLLPRVVPALTQAAASFGPWHATLATMQQQFPLRRGLRRPMRRRMYSRRAPSPRRWAVDASTDS